MTRNVLPARLAGLLLATLLLDSPARAQDTPGAADWENFDFTPGDTVLFFEDFSDAYVGDFPADRLSFVEGRMDVVERGGQRMLRTLNRGTFRIELPQALPERFTIEFDVEGTDERHTLHLWTGDALRLDAGGAKSVFAVVHPQGSGLTVGKYAPGPSAVQPTHSLTVGRRATVRISAEGPYLKMYVDERRVANVPKAPLVRSNTLNVRLDVYPHDDEALYVDDLRIAAGGRARLYDHLLAHGFFATQAVYFDVGKATLHPASTPFLDDVARLLTEHPDVRLLVEGHTDATGGDAVNGPLSRARAEAVRAFLVERRGIAADRLEAAGFGAQQPVAGNDTPEGRAQNRRVVFRRITAP